MVYLLLFATSYSQALFTAPDTICITDSLVVSNESRDASSYYWNFCSGSLGHHPEGLQMPSQGTLNGPAFVDFTRTDDGFYAFITNHTDATITREKYADGFLSASVSENLGSFNGIIPPHVQGIQVVENNGSWFAFIVGGQREQSRLVRLNFGNSLDNAPTATNLGNIGDLDYPGDLFMIRDGGNWFGFTVNYNSSSLTRFDFGNDLSGIPAGTNLGAFGILDQPSGILPIYENGHWFFFVSNYGSHEIIRLEFGASLENNPSGVSIGDDEYLYYPFDLTILRDCERLFGFVLNRFGDIVRLDFDRGLSKEPQFTSLGETGGMYNPQGISDVFRIGDTLYTFVANAGNSTLSLLYFPGCDNASISYSEDRIPPAVTYNTPGEYNVTLALDEGLPIQENYCKNIVVLESPVLELGHDTTMVPGSTIELDAGEDYHSYNWSTGDLTRIAEITDPGMYSLQVTNEYGCAAEDQINVIMDIGIPNFFTPNGDGYNDTWSIPFLKTAPESRIMVFDRFGNLMVSYNAADGDWDGRVNGAPVPADTYWYVIKTPGNQKPYKGSVTIKR